MKINLSTGKIVNIYISHGLMFSDVSENRYTTVKLVIDNEEWRQCVTCDSRDTFVKERGRKLALKKIFDYYRPNLTKEERKEIWQKVLPKRNIVRFTS